MPGSLLRRGVLAPVVAVACALAATGAGAAPGAADVYTWVDDEGGVHLTNVPEDGRYTVLIHGESGLDPIGEARPGTAGGGPQGPRAGPNAVAGPGAGAGQSAGTAGARSPGAATEWPFSGLIRAAGQKAGVDVALLHAVIWVESAYNPRAVSSRGAGGLMQLMPETARRYGVRDLFDPAENLRAGAQYLADLLRMFNNDLRLALAAYNAGEAAVQRFGNRIPPFPETLAYVPKVVDFYGRFRAVLSL